MKVQGLEVVKEGKFTNKVVKEVCNSIDMTESNEQTILLNDLIYECNIDFEDNEIYIRQYTQGQYSTKYGEGTLLDLLECYE